MSMIRTPNFMENSEFKKYTLYLRFYIIFNKMIFDLPLFRTSLENVAGHYANRKA